MPPFSYRPVSIVLRVLSSAVLLVIAFGFPIEKGWAQPFGADQLIHLQGTLEWGDYDADGDPDLVMTGTSNRRPVDGQRSIYSIIYRNDGDQTFVDIRAGIVPVTGSATWGDCDGDGNLDLAVMGGGDRGGTGDTPDTLAVYRNDGDDVFTTAGVSLDGVGGTEGEWLDYDGDGDQDLLVIGDSASIATAKIYRNAGSCSFTAVDAGIQAMEGGKVEAGDYDADGDPDLILVGDANGGGFGGGTALVYRNDGGTFVDIGAGLTPVTAPDADWGDYDGDGDLDLVVTGGTSGSGSGFSTTVYRNDGSDTFTDINANVQPISFGAGQWGDYDGDGDLDLFLGGSGVGFQGEGGAAIYRNTNGQFTDVGIPLNPIAGGSAGWADYDQDGDVDLITAGQATRSRPRYTETTLYRNEGSGIFRSGVVPAVGPLAWADYDGDGDLDVLADGVVYRNDGNREMVDIESAIPSGRPAYAWGDYDGDGDLDVAVGAGGSNIPTELYRNDGSDVFTDAGIDLVDPTFLGLSIAQSLDWGDYDVDGDLDLLVAGTTFNGAVVAQPRIFRNDGGSFADVGVIFPSAVDAAWGDYDGDGDLDVAFAGGQDTAGNLVSEVYRNDGSDTFTDVGAGLVGVGGFFGGSISWGDYDGDGDLDLVVTGDTNVLNDGGASAIVYRNDAGIFVDVGAALDGVIDGRAAWGDYDGDGNLDLLIAGQTSTGSFSTPDARLYRNAGSDTFVQAPVNLMGVTAGHSAWGDYDQDGDLDFALAGTVIGSVLPLLERTAVYENLRVDGSVLSPTEAVVSTSGRVAFATTGVRITFRSVHGSGRIVVTPKPSAPTNVSGVAEANVSSYRVVVDAPASLTPGPSTDIHFAVDEFDGITDPSNVVVYRRSVEGTGAFTALPTRYDATTDELIAVTTGFGEYVFASDTNPLPVELSSFTASASGDAVALTWTTASEENNVGFDIERSTDGEAFVQIGFKAGAGTTESTTTYRFTDADPPFATTLFYRLRQLDRDGTFEYSTVARVHVTPSAVAFLPSAPNPFQASTRLRYEMPASGQVTIQVFDMLGRQVATLASEEKAAGRHEVAFDASGLAAGTYFVRLRADDVVKIQMVRVVR